MVERGKIDLGTGINFIQLIRKEIKLLAATWNTRYQSEFNSYFSSITGVVDAYWALEERCVIECTWSLRVISIYSNKKKQQYLR